MEVATPVGIVVALVMIAVAFVMEGGSPMVAFSNPSAIIIIIGGTIGVGMASNRMSDIGPGFKATMKMMLPGKKLDGAAAVSELMEYADTARRDGLLALEEK
ncbi:MAG: MotA/TolQ/ExbB proton channel, partial [Frankiales bacterium]|nr:MotA/TolQ/ExbB proton channel [Frankiales bacterium]